MKKWWANVQAWALWTFRDPYDCFNPEWIERLNVLLAAAGIERFDPYPKKEKK